MNALTWIALGLFFLKIVWNLTIPYRLLRRLWKHEKGQERRGISLSLGIEVSLLLLATLFSWVSSGKDAINQPFSVLTFGGCVAIASYVHFFIVGAIGGWLITNLKARK